MKFKIKKPVTEVGMLTNHVGILTMLPYCVLKPALIVMLRAL